MIKGDSRRLDYSSYGYCLLPGYESPEKKAEDCSLLGCQNLKEERRIPPSKDHRPHALHNRYSERNTTAY